MNASPQTHAGIDRPARKKSLRRAHVPLQRKADAQHKDEVDQHDQPVDVREIHFEHPSPRMQPALRSLRSEARSLL